MPVSTNARLLPGLSSPHEDVVISGLAGYFPESENVYQLRDNLFNKVNMVTVDDRRWKFDHPKVPKQAGKVPNVSKFDAPFFGINYKQAHIMDPQCRLLMERTYEAIVDAGINPQLLKGQRTGVFVGATVSDTEKMWLFDNPQESGYCLTGCLQSMYANQISYWLGVTGPSYAVDTACSSSSYVVEQAFRCIRDGYCDSAVVGGCRLNLHPCMSLHSAYLGVLSTQGVNRTFDNDADGYVRSEAICVVFLQKARDAKRVYATVVNAKTNVDGCKNEGILHPSGEMHKVLLEQCYHECGADTNLLEYVEAHGTGTKVGDAEELKAITLAFCKDRKTPLLIGSIKSNMGHPEPASGLCGVTKVIIAMETGFIPPNLHYKNPSEGVESLVNGQLKVVTEKVPWTGSLAGINSLGFGGTNAHIVIQHNRKNKVNGGAPADLIPRLVIASGRTEEAVNVILKDFESRPVDAEFVHLIHDLQSTEIIGHKYRGYTLLPQDGRDMRSIKYYPGSKRPVWFVFTGVGSQWPGMGKSLLKFPVFMSAIEKCQEALKPYGVDVINIITSDDPRIFNNIVNCFVGIAACQIGLVDIMQAVGIEPEGIVGLSLGDLGCGYINGCFSAEQVVLAAYYCGLAGLESEFIKGSMAAVGLGARQAKKLCPPDIEVAYLIGRNFCILSGPAESMKKFMETLQEQGLFAMEMNCGNIAYHSKYISSVGPLLLKYLKQVIPDPKPWPHCWVSCAVPQSEWNAPLVTQLSAEYITNNLLNVVHFEDASRLIPVNAIAIEIAPHGLLQTLLENSLNKGITNIALTQCDHPEGTEWLLTALGKLYQLGLQPQLANLYPLVQYPVSRGTPMISPLVRWEHSEDWYVMYPTIEPKAKSGERSVTICLQDKSMEYLSGHTIDGRNLFPAAGYLELVWKSVGLMVGQTYTDVPVVFEDVLFHRATTIPKEGNLQFTVAVQKASGKFEVVEDNASIVSGLVRVPTDVSHEMVTLDTPKRLINDTLLELSSQDIYKELRLCGYEYQGLFRSLVCADLCGQRGKVYWRDNWVTFLDGLLQMTFLESLSRDLLMPIALQKLTVDTKRHTAEVQKLDVNNKDFVVPVCMNKELNIIQSAGVEVRGLETGAIAQQKFMRKPVLEKYVFTPYVEPAHLDLHTTLRMCTQIALENDCAGPVKVVEVHNQGTTPLSPTIALILADYPLTKAKPHITVLAKTSDLSGMDFDRTGLEVEEHELEEEAGCNVVIASNMLLHRELLETAASTLADGGCILAREKIDTETTLSNGLRLNIVFEKTLKNETLLLLRKAVTVERPAVIHVTGQNYEWLPHVQTAITSKLKHHILLVAQDEPLSGIVGLVNCICKESCRNFIRCFFILDTSAPPFDLNLPLYWKQLNKDLVMNIYSDGRWGSYRHLPLDNSATVTAPHAWAKIMNPGDLSSFKWLEGNLNPDSIHTEPNEELVHVYYSALNFRDVMTATGQVTLKCSKRRLNRGSVEGMEFSGCNQKGQRVMGLMDSGSLSTMVLADKNMMWTIPDHWTLEDAATVPMGYGTAYYALVMIGRMRKGESVLIHTGSGSVGQAAINICLHAGCTVYTTVGTEEKRDFIKMQFPQLTDRNIGCSRDTSFEQLVMSETNGRGVDLVLNTLSAEKLQASVSCLAPRGRFLEIARLGLANNTIGMKVLLKETSFHGVMIDKVFSASAELKKQLHDIMTEGILSGVVRPLHRTVFANTEVEQAFRYMAAGKHMGKVLVQIRPEENSNVIVPVPWLMHAHPQYFCNPSYTYIIAGGLGGFGLELADWLVLRGARKLVLSSRSGVRTGYQSLRIRLWHSYGATIVISLADITTETGVTELLSDANHLGQVDAIFNLAMVLHDRLLENQTEADFIASAGPKALATRHLDMLSRHMCPCLRQFVVFSSVVSGHGNAGQTNYGMNNSIMERICEARIRDGLPGLAVQWGPVCDVGLVAQKEEEQHKMQLHGFAMQRIASCLEVLDGFLRQSCPVVASMIVEEKHAQIDRPGTIVDRVSHILGIRDLKTISPNSTLTELGLDSMTAVEIEESLKREFEVYLMPQEIRGLTFGHLKEMDAKRLETKVEEQLSQDMKG